MSYGLMVYSVDIDKVLSACGSGDDGLRRAISGRFRDRIADTNDQLGYSNERGEPSVFEAIRHLILGQDKSLDSALYGYGLKYIVEFYGRFLDNSLFYPAPMEFITGEVGGKLADTGAVVKMSDLVYASPIQLPRPDDFPLYGHWTAADVAQSAAPVRTYADKTPELQAIEGWLTYAEDNGEGIVGYYH
jgi:hypothetical protein